MHLWLQGVVVVHLKRGAVRVVIVRLLDNL
jgi:hypothetical protein